MKRLESIETDKFSLEVFECSCGFHLGLDFTYLDQCGDLKVPCPNCGEELNTEEPKENEKHDGT